MIDVVEAQRIVSDATKARVYWNGLTYPEDSTPGHILKENG